MPGIYGSVPFVIGHPSKQKPVESGPCVRCGSTAYRQTYAAGAWSWEHEGCAPKPRIERFRTRTGAALSYVPRSYEEAGRSTTFDPQLARAIKESRRG